MSRIIRIDADVERVVLENQRPGETKQATLSRLVRERLAWPPGWDEEHVPGCDGNCAILPGSMQCFA